MITYDCLRLLLFSKAAGQEKGADGMYSVFIIDDDETAVNQIKDAVHWKSLHCKVIGTAANAMVGMEKILKMRPDIILTDISLPDVNGFEVINRLTERNYPGNYVIVTEYKEFEFARRAIDAGVSGYLLKPVTDSDIERVIKRIAKGNRQLVQSNCIFDYDSSIQKQKEIQEHSEQFSMPISAALYYIDRNIYSDLSLTVLCDAVSLSPSYFSRLFKGEVGMGFNEYIRLVKMNQARKLLQNPRNKAREVAELLGYHNYNYFFQTFKKQFGCSPRQIKNGRLFPY